MDADLRHVSRPVARGELLRLGAVPGLRVECLTGMVWLTMDHDARDVLLGAGEGFTVDRPDPVLVLAFEDSELLLLDGARP